MFEEGKSQWAKLMLYGQKELVVAEAMGRSTPVGCVIDDDPGAGGELMIEYGNTIRKLTEGTVGEWHTVSIWEQIKDGWRILWNLGIEVRYSLFFANLSHVC